MSLDTIRAGACFHIKAVRELWPAPLKVNVRNSCSNWLETRSLKGPVHGPAALCHRWLQQLPALYQLILICLCVNPETQWHSCDTPLWDTFHVRAPQQGLQRTSEGHCSLFPSARRVWALLFCKYWDFRVIYVSVLFSQCLDIHVRRPLLTVAASGWCSYLCHVIDWAELSEE